MDYKLMRKYGKYHFWCRVCHEEFDQYYKFKTHVHSKLPTLEEIAIIRDSKSMEWACDLCECTFKFQSYLKRHRLRHLNPEIQCPECEQQFHDEHSLNQHLAVSHGKDTAWHCDFCPKIYKFEASLKRHRLRHFDPKIECPLCKKLFYDKFILKQHTEFVHTNRKGFVCDLCDYATGNKSTLQAHIITKHTKNYPHICDQCGKGYTKKYMLLAHRRSVHDGEHYVCEDCGKMFKYISGFNEHRKLHNETSQKKESRRCEFCGKQFRCLKEHIKNVHLGEISFVCELCGKGFYTTNSLKIHVMRKHKKIRPLKCNVCGHGHVTKKELQQHMKRRHGENDRNDDDKEKPFQCNVCGKRFKMSMSLTDHLRKHSGEKAYTCKFCEENFLSKHYLKTHKCIGLSKNFKFT